MFLYVLIVVDNCFYDYDNDDDELQDIVERQWTKHPSTGVVSQECGVLA